LVTEAKLKRLRIDVVSELHEIRREHAGPLQRKQSGRLPKFLKKLEKERSNLCLLETRLEQFLSLEETGTKTYKWIENLREALELYLEDEDVEMPSEAEAPIVTIAKVDASG
jgi:vacuolar-type H+-ATPase subunit E/Vma4